MFNEEEIAVSMVLNAPSAQEMMIRASEVDINSIRSPYLRKLFDEVGTGILTLADLASFDTVIDRIESKLDKGHLERIKGATTESNNIEFQIAISELNKKAKYLKRKQALEVNEKAHVDEDLIELCIETPIGKYALELAESAKMPRNTTLLTVLSVFSSIACRYRSVSYRYGGSQPLSINFCGEQPPAAAKSRVLQEIQSPIVNQIRLKQSAIYSEIKDINEQIEAGDLEKEDAKALKAEIAEKKAELNKCFEFITDTTPEALDSSLQDSGGYFAIASAEQGAINSLLGVTYGDAKGGSSNKDLVLKGFNGEWHNSKRKGRETYAGHVVGTISALAQSGMIKNLLNASGNSGVIERFLLWSEASLLGTRDHTQYHKINEQIQARLDNSLTMMYNRVNNMGYKEILSLSISDRMWNKIALRRNELEPTIAETGTNSASLLRGIIGKYDLFVMKIAAVLHLSVTLDEQLINDERVKESMRIVDAYLIHIKALIAEQVVEALSDRDTAILEYIGTKKRTGKAIAKALFRRKCYIKGATASRTPVYEQLQKLIDRGLVLMTEHYTSDSIADATFTIE